MNRRILLVGAVVAAFVSLGAADPPRTGQEEAIQQFVASYVAAFNRGDAKALAASWCEDGQFVTTSGEVIQGRRAIQEGFETYFGENRGAKLELDIRAIRIERPDAAVEEGNSRVLLPNSPAEETTYVARYVKQDGKWLLQSVRDAEKAPSHYQQLQELEWLIGEWGDADGQSSVATSCRWTKNRNFIARSFAVSLGGAADLEGTQVIGWDPDKKVIRSWLFDSDGGFGVARWSRKGNRWTIQSLQVLPDGRKGSSTNLLTRVDDNSFTWESTNREVDGEVLPNVGPVTVVRKTSEK